MAKDTVLDAWSKGLAAAGEGVPVTENAYPRDTKLAEVWAKGWESAADSRPALAGDEIKNRPRSSPSA